MIKHLAITLGLTVAAIAAAATDNSDPYLWLENVEGEQAMQWVETQNVKSLGTLEELPTYQPIYDRALSIFDSQDRIPSPVLRGSTIYNFWQDKENPRGILRRTSLSSYKTEKPQWETVLDIDAMAKADDIQWVYKGADCLEPDYQRCMVTLSRGGSDAAEVREFDASEKIFVENGFFVPEAKSMQVWRDKNTLWVGTDWGPGSLTESGYPRIVKEWRRGTPLSEARTIFEASVCDVFAMPLAFHATEGRYSLIDVREDFFNGDLYLDVADGLQKLAIPKDASFKMIFRDHVIFSLRSEWRVGETSYASGTLLASAIDDLVNVRQVFSVIFAPSERASLDEVSSTGSELLVTTLDNVKSRLYRKHLEKGVWKTQEVTLPGAGAARIVATSDESDTYFYTYEDFIIPDTLYLSVKGQTTGVKSLPALFDATGITVTQHEATSKDGTRIPYFLIAPKGVKADGKAPTLLYGYGGFEISLTPFYSASLGAAWLERGGVYALANIRGGGEFGPQWHQAAVQENHIRNFEDFIAVAESLIERKLTSPRHLGIMGGSQGGLLVGGTFVLRPDLFNAVVCQVPLLDMQRYSKLLAGASWMSEYGNPDVAEDWAYIRTWSPYQLVKKDAKYPEVFFWTTTRDDRVHPAHARKMVAKMDGMGHPVLYFENTEGGHGSGSTNPQRAQVNALQYAYLWRQLGN